MIAAALVAAALLCAPASAFATRDFAISPAAFRFEADAGSPAKGEVVVSNAGDEPLRFIVYASDLAVDDKGQVSYAAPEAAGETATVRPSAWVRVVLPPKSKSAGGVPYLSVDPGRKAPVKFTLTAPAGTDPGDYNVVLFFEPFDLSASGEVVPSASPARLGAQVTLRVKGEVSEKLLVESFRVPAVVLGRSVPFEFLVRNDGNVDQRVGGRVLLLDRAGSQVASQTPVDGRIVYAMTGLEASGTITAAGSGLGRYSVRLDVAKVDDAGRPVDAGDAITQVREVWVVAVWLLVTMIVVGIIVVLLVTYLIVGAVHRSRLRRRRQTERAARSAALRRLEEEPVEAQTAEQHEGENAPE